MGSRLRALSRSLLRVPGAAALVAILMLIQLCATFVVPPPVALADHTTPVPQALVFPVTFETTGQNLWGPGSGDAPSSNTYTFFSQTWNKSDSERRKERLEGLDFGAEIGGSTSGEISLGAEFKGFSGGGVSVHYPVDISLSVPPADSFRPGERISIGSSALVKPGASMTVAPSAGDIALVGTFAFSGGATADVCFLECEEDIPIVPTISIPRQSGKILALTELEQVCDFAQTAHPTNHLLTIVYPSSGCEINEQQAWAYNLPFTGKLGLPNLSMTTTLLSDGKTLRAYGKHSDFINLEVDLAGIMTSVTGGTIGVAIPPLIPGVTAEATAFASTGIVTVSQTQEVKFSPTIQGTLVLPPGAPAVAWTVVNPAGVTVDAGFGRTIIFDVGNTVQIDVPSDLEPGELINVTPTFAMKNAANFSNNVTTTFKTDIESKAMEVVVETPEFEVSPGYVKEPKQCYPLLGCTEEVKVPAVMAPDIKVKLGPLWQYTLPAYTGTNNSLFDGNTPPWSLGGFSAGAGASFTLNPQYEPVVSITGPTAPAEGQEGTFDFSFSDADGDALTWRLEWGDGAVETGTGTAAGTSFSRSHTYADNGTYQARLIVDDGHAPGIATQAIAVTNVAPTLATPAVAATVNEYGVVTLSGTFTDPGVRDSYTVTIDWGGPTGQKEQGDRFTLPAGSTSFSRTHHYQDDNGSGTPSDVYTVTVTVTDKDGGSDARSVTTKVANVAPTVFAGSDRTIDEGSTTRLGVQLFGVNLLQGGDAETGVADWRALTGSVTTTRYAATEPVAWPLSFPADYPSSAWTVSSTWGAATTSVSQADSCNVFAYDQTGFRGEWIYSATALESGTLPFTWRHKGLHSWHLPKAAAYAWADGPQGRQTVTLWTGNVWDYFDSGVQSASLTLHAGYAYGFTVTGQNSDSAKTLRGSLSVCTEPIPLPGLALTHPGPAQRGSSYFSTGTSGSATVWQRIDISSVAALVDTGNVTYDLSGFLGGSLDHRDHAWLQIIFWGAGGAVPIDMISTDPVTVEERADATKLLERRLTGSVPVGTRRIEVRFYLLNRDQGTNYAAADNLALYLLPAPGAQLSAGFTDTGLRDSHTASIDWGDFSAPEAPVVTGLPGNRTLDLSHGYQDNGNYLVTATVTDDDAGVGQHSFVTAVRNVPPTVTAVEQVFVLGMPETKLLATFTDPGALDTHSVTIDWGDGTTTAGTVTETLGTTAGTLTRGTVTGTHAYSLDGPYPRQVTAQVTVTDKDGGATTMPVTITLTDLSIADTAMTASRTTLTEGGAVTFTGALGALVFPDGATTFTPTYKYTFDPGDGSAAVTGTATPGTAISRTHTYAQSGTYVATMRFQAYNGTTLATYDTVSQVIVVSNAPPAVAAVGAESTSEGGEISFATTFTDAGRQDTNVATVDWGDGGAAETLALTQGAGAGTVSGSHTYAQDGTYTATLTVTDGDGGAGVRTFAVTISNVAPAVTLSPMPSATEGESVTAFATFADPGMADTHTATIAWGDGETESVTASQAAISGSHLYANSGTYTVTVCVSDDAAETCQTQTAVIANAPPALSAVAGQASSEGETVTVTATFTDAGPNDSHTAVVTWGDGTVEAATVDPQARTITASHTYVQSGTYTAAIMVTDADHAAQGNGESSTVFAVTVANVSPTVFAGSDRTVNEGAVVFLAPAMYDDPGTADSHTAAIDWGDGTTAVGTVDDGTVAGSHPYQNDGIYTVTVCVTDDDGPGCDAFTVTVLNVAPAVDAGADQTVDEGTVVAVGAAVADPGAQDVVTTTIDWGDGTQTPGAAGAHLYANDGAYEVVICAADDDGGASCDELTVLVNNVTPAVSAGADRSANEGETVALTAAFTDSGPGDTHSAVIDWGDGSSSAGVMDAATGTVTGTHVYADNGTYTLSVCVTDADRAEGCDSLMVTVANVAPAVDAGADRAVYQGSSVALNPATFVDPGTSDGHTATINWGDGSVTAGEVSAQASIVAGSHTYRDVGTYPVQVCVADKEGASACDSMQVTVLNVAPAVFVGPDGQVDEGTPFAAAAPFTATVYATGFDGEAPDGVWGESAIAVSPSGERFLGRFGSGAAVLSLDNLPAHSQVTISFDLYVIDSWDGNGTVGYGPDIFEFGVVDGETLLRTTFSTQESQMQSYPGTYPGGSNPVGTGAAQVGGLGYGGSATYRLSFTVPHTEAAIAFRFMAANLQGIGDESWGIDNVTVTVPVAAPIFADPGTEGWTATVNYGDGSGVQPLALNPDRTFALEHVYGDNGSYDVTVTVTDGHQAVGSDSLRVVVGNVAPVVEAGADRTVAEGSPLTLAASFSDPGVLDTHSVTVDWGDGATGDALDASHVYADNGTYTVTVCVTDDDGSAGCDSLQVTVANVAPVVDAGADRTAAEGSPLTLAASFSDPGVLDTHAVTVDWGDGATGDALDASHVYADNGTYTVTVCVTDDDGSAGCDTLNVVVENVAPTVDAGPDQTLDEGTEVVVSASVTDQGARDVVTTTIDWGDGTQSSGAAASHLYADDGAYEVVICAADDDGGVSCDALSALVNNVTPTVSAGADRSANEGETVAITATFTDPGPSDTHTAVIDWGDGTSSAGMVDAAAGTVTGTHVYADNGTYTVTVCVTDDDGSAGCDSLQVTVANVAPSVDAGADRAVDEGSPLTLAANFSDPGVLDTHAATVEWGDGATGDALDASHIYADNGTYTVTVCVTDDDGSTGCDSLNVLVENVAPTVDAGPNLTIYSGQTLTLNATYSDPGLTDTHTATIDWADGTPPQPAAVLQGAGSGSLSAAHRYTVPGTYTVTVCVTDHDGNQGCDTMTLEVKALKVSILIQQQSVNLKSKGTIPVAVLSGTYEGQVFDATTIIRSTLRFAGAAATESGGKSAPDLNKDGLPDMLYHFQSSELTLTPTSTEGCLTGVTESGIHFTACAPVQVVGASRP
jgi:PKD repeat protein